MNTHFDGPTLTRPVDVITLFQLETFQTSEGQSPQDFRPSRSAVSGVEMPDETCFEGVIRSEVLLAEAEQLANLGSWELDIETGLISRSANLCKMLGAEALTKVHRHSGTQSVAVRLAHAKGYIAVEMQDHGSRIPFNGFSQRSRGLTGVGIRGMRERVKERKGMLAIENIAGKGTTVRVILPCAPANPWKKLAESKKTMRSGANVIPQARRAHARVGYGSE
jgi:hypothetical protein